MIDVPLCPDPMWQWWPDLIASLAGALFGALAAFQLEHWRRRRELREARVEAGYRALMALGDMESLMVALYDHAIAPWRGESLGWFSMPELSPPPELDRHVDPETIAFLLARGQDADVQAVQNALFAEQQFYGWLTMLRARNAKKIEAKKLLQAKSDPRRSHTEDELEAIFGLDMLRSLKESFDGIALVHDQLEAQLNTALEELHRALERNFRGQRFLYPHRPKNDGSQAAGDPRRPDATG